MSVGSCSWSTCNASTQLTGYTNPTKRDVTRWGARFLEKGLELCEQTSAAHSAHHVVCAAEACSHNSKPFPRYRAPQNVNTRARALRTTEITIGRPPGTDVYDRPAARALGESMPGTQSAHPGRGGGWGAGLGEYGGITLYRAVTCTCMGKHVGFCTNYSRNEPYRGALLIHVTA